MHSVAFSHGLDDVLLGQLAVSVGIYEVKVIVNDRLKKTVVAERTYRFSPAQKKLHQIHPMFLYFRWNATLRGAL